MQIERQFSTGGIEHRLILAAEAERETFHARDTVYGGFTDQDRSRSHKAITAEWRASAKASPPTSRSGATCSTGSRMRRALRASLLGDLGAGFALTTSYSEGIAQPTFFDLYGFFPGNFVGNPSLKPESSRGWEAGVRYHRGGFAASLTGYRQRLHDEIVDVGDPITFLRTTINRDDISRRSGVEAEASWRLADKLRLSANYAYLHATEPDAVSGRPVTEHRRPSIAGRLPRTGRSAAGAMGRRSLTLVRNSIPATTSRTTSSGFTLIGWREPGSLMRFGRGSTSTCADQTCSIRATRTRSVITPKAAACSPGSGWRVGDHRREFALGGDFAIEHGPACEPADPRALLDKFDFQTEQDAGLDGFAEFHAVDRHEINELPEPARPRLSTASTPAA